MEYINLTPHTIKLNNGAEYPSKGLARVKATFKKVGDNIYSQQFGEVEGLPAPEENVVYIVSALVLQATDRADVVAPATGHPETIRNDKGHILSVPGFVR